MTFARPGSWVRHLIVSSAMLMLAGQAAGQERDFCPERPGLDTPPCIVDRGHASVETSAVDWTFDRAAGTRTDTVLLGDSLLRVGLGPRLEAQIGWTAYGQVRVRDAAGVTRHSGTGDVHVGLKVNLLSPDGKGASVAIKPFATLPAGGSAIGAGTWSAGAQMPLSFSINDKVQVIATPEVLGAADQDGRGRHLAWGSAGGVQVALTEAVSLALEAQMIRDEDPAGYETRALGEVSLAWQPGKASQVDLGVVAGLNHQSPDLELIAGIARRF